MRDVDIAGTGNQHGTSRDSAVDRDIALGQQGLACADADADGSSSGPSKGCRILREAEEGDAISTVVHRAIRIEHHAVGVGDEQRANTCARTNRAVNLRSLAGDVGNQQAGTRCAIGDVERGACADVEPGDVVHRCGGAAGKCRADSDGERGRRCAAPLHHDIISRGVGNRGNRAAARVIGGGVGIESPRQGAGCRGSGEGGRRGQGQRDGANERAHLELGALGSSLM